MSNTLVTYSPAFTPLKPEEVESSKEMLFFHMENCIVSEKNINTSELNDSIIRNVKFERSVFKNCDFDTSLIENCVFDHVKFQGCDFSSTKIKNCIFKDCSINNSDISDNEWNNVTFERVRLLRNNILNTHVTQCSFSCCKFSESTAHLNYFIECQFIKADFSGSSFSYNIFRNTSLSKSSLQCNNIGTLHGLKINEIIQSKFTLCYVKNDISGEFELTEENFCDTMIQSYVHSKLFFVAAFCNISYSNGSIYVALHNLCQLLLAGIKSEVNIRALYLDYTLMLLRELCVTGQIGYGDIRMVLDTLEQCRQVENLHPVLTERLLRVQLGCQALMEHESIHPMHQLQGNADDQALIKFHFESKPDIDTQYFCSELERITGSKIELLYEGPGSFIAIILACLLAAKEILEIVDRCLDNAVKITENIKEIETKEVGFTFKTMDKAIYQDGKIIPYKGGALSNEIITNVKIAEFMTSRKLTEVVFFKVKKNMQLSFSRKNRNQRSSE